MGWVQKLMDSQLLHSSKITTISEYLSVEMHVFVSCACNVDVEIEFKSTGRVMRNDSIQKSFEFDRVNVASSSRAVAHAFARSCASP